SSRSTGSSADTAPATRSAMPPSASFGCACGAVDVVVVAGVPMTAVLLPTIVVVTFAAAGAGVDSGDFDATASFAAARFFSSTSSVKPSDAPRTVSTADAGGASAGFFSCAAVAAVNAAASVACALGVTAEIGVIDEIGFGAAVG